MYNRYMINRVRLREKPLVKWGKRMDEYWRETTGGRMCGTV